MPSHPQNAYIHTGDWDAQSDSSHPIMQWMHEHTDAYDTGDFNSLWLQWHTEDFTYAKASGQVFPPGKASWDACIGDYSFFTKYHHEPYFLVYWDREQGDGYEMIGNAWLYFNLPGGTGKGIKDARGGEWEMRLPGAFYFVFRKDSNAKHGGINMASVAITSDSGPVVVELLKRGVMKPADLGL